MARVSVLVLAALSALAVVARAGETSCPAADGPVVCNTCPDGADVNVMSTLPRRNRKGKQVDSNLAAYNLFSCYGDGTPDAPSSPTEPCVMHTSELSVSGFQAGASSDTSIVNYAEGLVVYAGFGLLCALLCILVAALFVCGRCCCCCIRGGCCGKRFPTYAMTTWRMGFREVEAPLLGQGGKYELAYTGLSRWGTRLCMLTYVILVAAFIAVGQLRGNEALTTSMQSIASSPTGFMNTARGLSTPLTNLVVNLAADLVHPMLTDANHTIASNVNMNLVVDRTRCIIDGVRNDLPSPQVLIEFVDSSTDKLDVVRSTADALAANITDTLADLSNLTPTMDALSGNLTLMYTGLAQLNTSIDSASANLGTLQTSLDVFNSSSGGARAVANELHAVRTNLPSTAAANDASYGGTNSLNTLIAGSLNGDAGAVGRADLMTKLVNINASMANIPDLNATADKINVLMTEVTNLRTSRVLDSLFADLTSTQAGIDTLPAVTTLNATIQSLRGAIDALSVAGIKQALIDFNSSVANSIPNVTVVHVELDKILSLSGLIGCMDDLVNQVTIINETLVRLPQAFSNVRTIITDVNRTYEDNRAQITDLKTTLDDLSNVTSAMPNISTYLVTLDDIQAQIDNPPIDYAAIDSSLASTQSQLDGVNVTALADLLRPVNDSIWSSDLSVSAAQLTNLRDLQDVLVALRGSIMASHADLVAFDAARHCTASPNTCTSDADCGGGVGSCQSGLKKCTNSASDCNADSDCTAPGVCQFHLSVHQTAQGLLHTYSQDTTTQTEVAQLEPLESALNASADSVSSTPSLLDKQTELDAFRTALRSVPLNSSLTALEQVRAQMDPNSLGMADVNATLQDALQQINALDLSSIRSQLVSLNDTFNTLRGDLDEPLNMADRVVTALDTFVSDTLPSALPRLARASLESVEAASGFRGLVTELIDVADRVVQDVAAAMNTSISLNLTDSAESMLKYTDVLTNATNTRYGPLYFFMKLAQRDDSLVTPAEYEAAGGGSVALRPNGLRWSGNRACMLQPCVVTTIDALNKKPLGELSAELSGLMNLRLSNSSDNSGSGSSGNNDMTLPNVPLSRENLLLIPYAIPLLVMLLGFCGAVGFCGKRWQRVPACCSGFWICCVLPWIFIIVGALAFPLVMFLSDGCRGGVNLGYQYVSGSEAFLCAKLPNSTYLPATSSVPGTCLTRVQDVELRVRPSQLYGALLGSCVDYPTAVPELFASVRAAVMDAPTTILNKTVNDVLVNGDSLGGMSLRPAVLSIVYDTVNNTGSVASALVDDLSAALSCDTLNRGISLVTNSVCCEFMTSVYWLVSSWYLIAFSMCLCGFCASVLGYKRFPNKLWGPDYKARNRTSPTSDRVEGAAAGGGGSAPAAADLASEAMLSADIDKASNFPSAGQATAPTSAYQPVPSLSPTNSRVLAVQPRPTLASPASSVGSPAGGIEMMPARQQVSSMPMSGGYPHTSPPMGYPQQSPPMAAAGGYPQASPMGAYPLNAGYGPMPYPVQTGVRGYMPTAPVASPTHMTQNPHLGMGGPMSPHSPSNV